MCDLNKYAILFLVIVLLVATSLACGSSAAATPTTAAPRAQEQPPEQPAGPRPTNTPAPTNLPEPTNIPEAAVSEPTLATCNAWIRENHSLEYSNHGCTEYTEVLESVANLGGGVIPVGDNRLFITWFPDGWDQLPDKKLVVTLHGNGGCAEKNFEWWHSAGEERNYAVVSLQYAEEDVADEDPQEEHLFDEAEVIYANLGTMLDDLQTYCPLSDAPVVYHGYSRGSALSYHIALLDRAVAGRKVFSAFIADSGGTGPAGTGDVPPGYLKDAPADAYAGARFWLYCGEKDKDGVRCDDMEKARDLILRHGGTVDELYVDPKGGHGIFIQMQAGRQSRALPVLFDYIDAIGSR